LLRCALRTGRTHQIRVHLKKLGHPIIGDALYSGPQWRGIPDKRVQKTISAFPRQALHASRLTLPDGRTFEAPMPEDMNGLLQALRA
ncbi:MAG TPA: RNA pseudouridine synthase, partial [Thermoanaerobaculia bacterium]|nr:RNA pseudouridine synthase [Thermoanaerobaculia bacterium]